MEWFPYATALERTKAMFVMPIYPGHGIQTRSVDRTSRRVAERRRWSSGCRDAMDWGP